MKPLQNDKDRRIIELVRSAAHGFHVHISGAIEFNDRKDREAKIEQSFRYLRNLPRRI
jgi:hypothetical protein